MKRIVFRVLIAVMVMVAITSVVLIGSCEIRTRKYERAFDKIETGYSKQDVLEMIGEPKEALPCKETYGCKDMYIYYSFMERWGYIFDNDNKVIDKFYNVSY